MGINTTTRIGIFGTSGAVLFAVGAILNVVFPTIYQHKVKSSLKLENGTDIYDSWVKTPVPIYMQFYFFNVTNSDDILINGSKPILKESGPYTFRQYRRKVNISFNEHEDTVNYRQIKWFIFDPEMSNGSLRDNITSLNVPFVSLAQRTERHSLFEQFGLSQIIRLHQTKLFITRTVDELLFKGYFDKMLDSVGKRAGKEYLPNGMFGYFYGQNYTLDPPYTIYTGVKDSEKFMHVKTWNNMSTLPYWNSESCNMINGSDGSFFKPFLQKDDIVYSFVSDFCRSVQVRFEEEVDIHGIKTYRFAVPFSLMAAADLAPENKCFCPNDKDCLRSGAFSISRCREGSPIALSLPHFYHSDDRYYEAVVGLNKNKTLHSSTLNIEPITGVIVKANKRAQINIALKRVSHILAFRNVTEILFPLLWLDENVDWPPEFAQGFYEKVIKPQVISNTIIYVLLAIGGFVLLWTAILVIKSALMKIDCNKD